MNIPFPPVFAEYSARSAKNGYELRKGQAPADHTTYMVGAYRLPSGEVRPAYDYYDPQYPEGAEPGLANIANRLEYAPNGTYGYKSSCTLFMALDEVPIICEDWDLLSVAHLRRGESQCFAMALSEGELQDQIGEMDSSEVEVVRAHKQTHHSMGEFEPPTVAVMIGVNRRNELHIATTEEALVEGLAARMPFLDLHEKALDEAIVAIASHGEAYGWTVTAGALDPENPELRRILDVEVAGPNI